MKQAFYPLCKQNIVRVLQQESTFLETFLSVPGCQTCMYKRGISRKFFIFLNSLLQKILICRIPGLDFIFLTALKIFFIGLMDRH